MTDSKSPKVSDDKPGVPGFPSWAAVYVFVVAVFALNVAFLSILPLIAR